MNPIFSYIDYRQYLKDYYAEQKQSTRFFSYRYFSQKAGINSPNFLKLVIEGKRNLTAATTVKFATALRLTDKESQFFRHLVLFNQAVSAEDKQSNYAVMLSMMHTVREQKLTVLEHEYYNKWYIPVVRELICLRNFKDDYHALGAAVAPPIGAREARFAVKVLLQLKFIEKQADGSCRQSAPALVSDSSIARMAVRSFNREMIRKAEASLDAVPVAERNAFGVTIGISKACYDVLVSEMAAFRDRVVAITNSDRGSSRVYQMQLQLFPLSSDVGQGEATGGTK